MSQRYEIEIKSLLGAKEHADAFRKRLLDSVHKTDLVGRNRQLNHYFVGGDVTALCAAVASHVESAHRDRLRRILEEGRDHSIRTRQKDDRVYLVVKASVDDTTSANGIARMEFEEPVTLTLEALDRLLLDAGFTYQAKWSREREEYTCGDDVLVCLDRNAGYGYLVEFECMVGEDEDVDAVQAQLRALMSDLGADELPQDRLERMFAYYNAHWPEYYGTEKVFTVE